jgi:CRP/FNR family transcriptional regulator, cyclic AMP receptor protein
MIEMDKARGAPVLESDRDAAVLRLIGRQSILSLLPEADLRALVRQGNVRTLRERELIFAHGDEGRSVMIVLEGYVKLSNMTAGGREVVLEIAGPGRVFGELATLNDWPRTADATALGSARVLQIEGGQFSRALARAPEAMFAVIRLLSQRLRVTTEQVTDTVSMPAPARLAKAIMHLAALHSHNVKEGLRIDLPLSQRELGGMTGLTRESINKHLATWRDAGWVALSGKSLTLLDVGALQTLLSDHELPQ